MLRNQIRSLLILAALSTFASAQCPWQRESVELQSACLCSYNLGHDLSVQCDIVEWPTLLEALNKHAINTRLDLLYVNNSTIGSLDDNVFSNLKIKNIQLSGCKIKSVSKEAFKGQEGHLKNLNLQDNELKEVPVESLRPLRTLSLLDLSHNKITSIPAGAFETLTKLATLKLSDNNVTLDDEALRGLEGCLKNLNLKGTRQREVPLAVRGMKTLAFLDLSQNSLRALPGKQGVEAMEDLNSLTAINLERNLIHEITKDAFRSVNKTLSSLSLLNNLLPDFPTEAMSTLKELRVLDIGFNLLTELPTDAFKGNPSITLLALDGNPLATIPFDSLSHLNNTLRGLSLGGRFLHCDCRLAWVVNWIRNGDLQVTSRERNPQFCGSPPRFRDRGFYSILPEELACPKQENEGVGVATVVSAELDDVSVVDTVPTVTKTTSRKPTRRTSTSTSTSATSSSSTTMKVAPSTSTKASTTTKVTTTTTSKSTSTGPTQKAKTKSTTSPWKNTPRPPLVMGYPAKSRVDEDREVMVKNAFRQDNSVIIQWGSETANILGFRVVYRLFGDKTFKQGPPLEASEREFKIKNVPSQECIIVCVVSLETPSPTPESVPHSQCREVRTQQASASSMDKITIGASAAICGTIVVAVIVFVAAGRRRSKQLRDLRHAHKAAEGMKPPLVGGLPTVMGSCCGGGYGQSPGGGMSSLATLNAYNSAKDWDQISGYSNHSIQRPRLYPLEQPSSLITDDMRSHFSSKGNRPRSMADGQSQHSFSNHSGRYLTANAFPTNLLSSRQDLRQSRQSLAVQSDRLSARLQAPSQSVSSSRRSRPRSRSRDHHRPSSRYSTAGSTHTLNNYCGDTSDNNWTDHDMDIYMARAPTARNGMVPL